MSGDLAPLAAEITPYVTTAVSAYGGAVLVKVQDKAAAETADAAVGFGRRMVQRIFGTRQEGEEVPEALADVIADPHDADYLGALRTAIRKALAADEALATELRAMLANAPALGTSIAATGERSIAADTISGIAATGDNTRITR